MGNWLGGTHLGLTYGQVRRVSSDPSWPEAFQRLVVQLRAARPGGAGTAVEHVGSAAVSGLAANRSLTSLSAWPRHRPIGVITLLQPLVARYPGNKGDGGGLLLVLEDRPAHRVAHLHVVGYGDAQWRRYLALRDRLRADQAVRSAYAQLKGDLAAQFSGDRRAYTAAKAAFIQQLLGEDGRTATPDTADQ